MIFSDLIYLFSIHQCFFGSVRQTGCKAASLLRGVGGHKLKSSTYFQKLDSYCVLAKAQADPFLS